MARLRQGDPELAESETDGFPGVRPSDAVLDQVVPELAHVPQAEVHQALLARVVEWIAPWPQPRLWYLPGEARSILLLSGDGCGRPPDSAFLEEADQVERVGGTLSYYLMQDAALAPPAARRLRERGHEISIHPYAEPLSVPSMAATLEGHVRAAGERYGVQPRTVRHHCLQWLGWAEQAKLEQAAGLRMDLNFVTTRPVRNGYLFGAGRPLRFVDETGAVIDTWQQPTQFEDDVILGSHEISLRAGTAEANALYDELLRDSVERWHTVLAVNLHPANYIRFSGEWGRHVIASTAARGVPLWSGERWLQFTAERATLDVAPGRQEDGDGRRWRFRVDGATTARDVVLLLPLNFAGRRLREPADGADYEIHGWRYRGVPLRGGPLSATAVYE